MNTTRIALRAPASRARAALLAALALSAAGSLHAQTSGTWTSTTGGNWSDIANWSSGAGPVATGGSTSANVTATFSASGTQTVNLDTNQTVQKLAFSTGTYTISSSNGSVLTLAGSSTPVIDGNAAIGAVIDGTQGFSFGPGGARSLYLTGNNIYTGVTTLSSGGKIYVGSNNGLGASGSGNGTVINHSNNAAVQLHLYNSITTQEDISMRLTSGNATALTAGATLIWSENGTSSVNNNITLGGTITVDRGSSGSTYTDTAGISIGSYSNLVINGNVTGAATTQAANTVADATRLQISASNKTTSTATINGVISDGTITAATDSVSGGANGGLSVYLTGEGRTIFTAANTYSGRTVVNAGTLLINNTSGSGTGTGSVSVSSGATFGGIGIIRPTGTNGVTFASGADIAPGDLSSSGSAIAAGEALTFDLSQTTGSVVFASGATMSFNLNAAADTPDLVAESLVFTGLLTNQADIAFNNNLVNFSITGGLLADGLYTLVSFDAANAYTGQLVLGAGLEDYDASLLHTSTGIQLAIGSIPEPSVASLAAGLAVLGLASVRRRRRA